MAMDTNSAGWGFCRFMPICACSDSPLSSGNGATWSSADFKICDTCIDGGGAMTFVKLGSAVSIKGRGAGKSNAAAPE